MNLQEEILKIKNEMIDEFDKRVEALKEEQEFPQSGDDYWYIDDEGDLSDIIYTNHRADRYRQKVGNIYRTEDEAEFALEKLKVEAELLKLSDSWDLEITQYTFSFNWEVGEIEAEYPDYNQYPNSYYFNSVDDLQQAIETVGEKRIKKYIFGVED